MELIVDKEFKNLIFPLTKDEYSNLRDSILAEGCRDAIVIWNNTILDGHNRYEICNLNGLPFSVKNIELDSREDAINWIIDNQLGRRNLAPWQLSILRGKRYNIEKRKDKGHGDQKSGRQNDVPKTSERLAKEYGVSSRTVERDSKLASAAERASEELEVPMMRLTKAQILEAARKIMNESREERRTERLESLKTIAKKAKELSLETKYNVIYADPPWKYDYSLSSSREIENQYPTMELEEILNLPISKISSDDCVLFLWATSPKLEEALNVIMSWGFRYVTNAVWIKDKIGMGYYFRQQHELLLIATKGNLPTPPPETRVSSVISAPRTEHSEKPEEVYEIIETMYKDLPKIELFARNTRKGWESWGNQI